MDLSVILVTPQGFNLMAKTLAHLERQTRCGRLELIFVVPSRAAAGELPELPGFAGVQVLEYGPIAEMGGPTAAAVRAARAPLVVTGEDHSFPDPDWAEELIKAHQGPYAAVGALMLNGNPERMESWVNLFCHHGAHTGWTRPLELPHLPGHNTSYKREVLLQLGDELAGLFNFEILLHARLRASGHRLLLHPGARVRHLQWSYPSSLIITQFVCMRSFAATRCERWSLARRLVYTLGSPLLPALKFFRMLPDLRRSRSQGYWPWILPYLFVALVCGAVGEAAGYSLGEGGAHRMKFRLDSDREHLAANYSR